MYRRQIGNHAASSRRRNDVTKSKPLLLLALPLIAATALVACGSDSESSDDRDASTDATPTDTTPTNSGEATVPASVSDSLDGRSYSSTQVDGYDLVPDSVITISFDE